MNVMNRNRIGLAMVCALQVMLMLAFAGCSDRDLDDLVTATAEADPIVFIDAFGAGLDYAAFEGSYYDALVIDDEGGVEGSTALRFDIPLGNWAGGSFYTHGPRDLSTFNALTFKAKASQVLELNSAGLGIGIIADAAYQCEIGGVPLSQVWTDVVIPVPNPDRLTSERGMFWMSEAEAGAAVTVWFDDVQYAAVEGITDPRPTMPTMAVEALLGETVPISGCSTTYSVNGADVEVSHTAAHFDYASSDTTVAKAQGGIVTAVGGGTATITATLRGVTVDGEITVTVIGPPAQPAPTPTAAAADVISIFSDAYTENVPVDTWRATWSTHPGPAYDQQIGDDNVKAYLGLRGTYLGIEFTSNQIDAATPGMTHFHMDVYTDEGSVLYLKLVDFGPDGAYGGGDDTEKNLIMSSVSDPAYLPGQWSSLDIPLTTFEGMNFGHVSQLVLQSGNINNIWVDNIYFHR